MIASNPAAGSSIAGQQPQGAIRLEPGHVTWKALAPGGRHRFVVDLRAGQAMAVVVRQQGVDVVLSVIDPSGHEQHRVDRPNVEWGREGITIIADVSGTYQLDVITLSSGGPPGRYQLEVAGIHEADSSDRQRVDAEHEVTEAEIARAMNTPDACRRAAQGFERAASLWRELREPYEEGVALYGLA